MGMKPAPRPMISNSTIHIKWEPEFTSIGPKSREEIIGLINKSVIDFGHEYEEFHASIGCLRILNNKSIFVKCVKCDQFMNITYHEVFHWRENLQLWKAVGLPTTHSCGYIQLQQTLLNEYRTSSVIDS